MKICSVLECRGRQNKSLKLCKFPINLKRAEEWNKYLQENDIERKIENFFLCELHFMFLEIDGTLNRAQIPSIPKNEWIIKVHSS